MKLCENSAQTFIEKEKDLEPGFTNCQGFSPVENLVPQPYFGLPMSRYVSLIAGEGDGEFIIYI